MRISERRRRGLAGFRISAGNTIHRLLVRREREREREREKEGENDLRFTILPFFILGSVIARRDTCRCFLVGFYVFIYLLCVGRKSLFFFFFFNKELGLGYD